MFLSFMWQIFRNNNKLIFISEHPKFTLRLPSIQCCLQHKSAFIWIIVLLLLPGWRNLTMIA